MEKSPAQSRPSPGLGASGAVGATQCKPFQYPALHRRSSRSLVLNNLPRCNGEHKRLGCPNSPPDPARRLFSNRSYLPVPCRAQRAGLASVSGIGILWPLPRHGRCRYAKQGRTGHHRRGHRWLRGRVLPEQTRLAGHRGRGAGPAVRNGRLDHSRTRSRLPDQPVEGDGRVRQADRRHVLLLRARRRAVLDTRGQSRGCLDARASRRPQTEGGTCQDLGDRG